MVNVISFLSYITCWRKFDAICVSLARINISVFNKLSNFDYHFALGSWVQCGSSSERDCLHWWSWQNNKEGTVTIIWIMHLDISIAQDNSVEFLTGWELKHWQGCIWRGCSTGTAKNVGRNCKRMTNSWVSKYNIFISKFTWSR